MSQITLVTQGHKTADWAQTLINQYIKRTESWWSTSWKHHPALKSKSDPLEQWVCQRHHQNRWLVALDEHGKSWSSEQLALQIQHWLTHHHAIDFIVGPSSGLSANIKQQCQQHWSLSDLTLTHEMAAVVTAEQIYRAATLAHGHPYHKP